MSDGSEYTVLLLGLAGWLLVVRALMMHAAGDHMEEKGRCIYCDARDAQCSCSCQLWAPLSSVEHEYPNADVIDRVDLRSELTTSMMFCQPPDVGVQS